MCAPLRARGRLIGAAYVDNRFMSGVFGQEDLELLVTFANQAALAIDNARLFTQTDQALQRRVEELSIFQQIDHQLNGSLDLKRVLTHALDWAIQLTSADCGSLGLLRGDNDEFHFLAQRGRHAEHQIDTHHPIVMQALLTGEAAKSRHESVYGPVTQLAVPIEHDAVVTGLILLESGFVNAFSAEDIAFVERVASRAGVAIENARLYEEVRHAKQQQSDFIAVVTHELRAPMTAIMGYSDLVMSGMAGELNPEQHNLLSIVNRNVDRMRLLIEDLSDINRIEMGQMQFKFDSFDITDVVTDVAQTLRDQIAGKQQKLTLYIDDELPLVCADRARTGQILTNLVTNAHKYTPEEGRIGIRVFARKADVQVDVIDNGIGISAEDQEKLFTQFFRVASENVRQEMGWGLGLSIVKMLIEEQGGTISFHSELGKGTVFSFTLPLAAATFSA